MVRTTQPLSAMISAIGNERSAAIDFIISVDQSTTMTAWSSLIAAYNATDRIAATVQLVWNGFSKSSEFDPFQTFDQVVATLQTTRDVVMKLTQRLSSTAGDRQNGPANETAWNILLPYLIVNNVILGKIEKSVEVSSIAWSCTSLELIRHGVLYRCKQANGCMG